MTISTASIAFIAVLGLLGIAVYGFLFSRNLLKMIITLQIMVKGAVIFLVLVGHLVGNIEVGQSMALTVIVADTIVAVIGMALSVQIRRHFGTIDTQSLTTLRR